MQPKDKRRGCERRKRKGRAYSLALKTDLEQSKSSEHRNSKAQASQSQESDVDTDAASITSKASRKGKKAKLFSSLTEEEEKSMVEWLEQNPDIYNKKMKAYKDMTRKESLWRGKACKLGKDVAELKTWYTSLRTRYGRLKKKKSSQEDFKMTERDEWVYSHFLRPYVNEVHQKPTVTVSNKWFVSIQSLKLIPHVLLMNNKTIVQICAVLISFDGNIRVNRVTL